MSSKYPKLAKTEEIVNKKVITRKFVMIRDESLLPETEAPDANSALYVEVTEEGKILLDTMFTPALEATADRMVFNPSSWVSNEDIQRQGGTPYVLPDEPVLFED